MAVAHDESVAVGPGRVGGVEAKELREEEDAEVRQPHGRPGVPRLGVVDTVHREEAQRIGALCQQPVVVGAMLRCPLRHKRGKERRCMG